MQEFFEIIKDRDLLVKPITLLIGIGAILGLAAGLDGLVQNLVTTGVIRRILIYGSLEVSWIAYWFFRLYHLPKTKKDKIGIVIAIHTEDVKVRTRLENDLVVHLQKFIDDTGLRKSLDLILLENHQAKKVGDILQEVHGSLEEWRASNNPYKKSPRMNKIQKRMQAHLYIWGRIVERKEKETKYFFESNAYIRHRPINKALHTTLAIDFKNVWLQQINFNESAEYSGFLFSASQMYLAAKYIIGVAAFISNDPFIAVKLHEGLKEELKNEDQTENLKYIRNKLDTLLAEEYAALARTAQTNFTETRKYLTRCFQYNSNNYAGLLTKAILEFVEEHNPEKALATIRTAKNYAGRDGTWRYSQGFLLMYLGRFDKAIVVYNQIAEYSYETEPFTLAQVYSFNENLLKREPDKIQSYYILGLLKYRKDGNLPHALEYFETFIEKAGDQREYMQLSGSAKGYKTEIEAQMGVS